MSIMDGISMGVNVFSNAMNEIRDRNICDAEERSAAIDEYNRRVYEQQEYNRERSYQDNLAMANHWALKTYDGAEKFHSFLLDLNTHISNRKSNQIALQKGADHYIFTMRTWINELQRQSFLTNIKALAYTCVDNDLMAIVEKVIKEEDLNKIKLTYFNEKTLNELVSKRQAEFIKLDYLTSPSYEDMVLNPLKEFAHQKVELKEENNPFAAHYANIQKYKRQYDSVFDHHYDSRLHELLRHNKNLQAYAIQLFEEVQSRKKEYDEQTGINIDSLKEVGKYAEELIACANTAINQLWEFERTLTINRYTCNIVSSCLEKYIGTEKVRLVSEKYLTQSALFEIMKEVLGNSGDPRAGFPARGDFTYYIKPTDDISELVKKVTADSADKTK